MAAQRAQIECIVKSDRYNPHERITHVGGGEGQQRWKITEAAAIGYIKSGTYAFWTQGGGKTANVIIASHLNREYLKTENDGVQPDNLLALNSCPI